jgi:hypothetical protein
VRFPLGTDAQLGRVADPALIGRLGGEVLPQHVVGVQSVVIAVGGDRLPLDHPGDEAVLLFDPNDSLPTHMLAPLDEVIMDARTAVVPAAARN